MLYQAQAEQRVAELERLLADERTGRKQDAQVAEKKLNDTAEKLAEMMQQSGQAVACHRTRLEHGGRKLGCD